MLLLLLSLLWNAYMRRQIQQRKRAERALNDQFEFMRALVNETPHPIYVRDREGVLKTCNDSYLKTFAAKREEVIGKSVMQMSTAQATEAAQYHADYLRVVAEGNPLILDRTLLINGKKLTIYHWILPYRDSTGEVQGMASTFGLAYYKSQEAADASLPTRPGRMLVSLSEKPDSAAHVVREFQKLGFTIVGTEGTIAWLAAHGVEGAVVHKINEGRPNVIDMIVNREVALVLNTPSGRRDSRADDASIRQAAIKYKVP